MAERFTERFSEPEVHWRDGFLVSVVHLLDQEGMPIGHHLLFTVEPGVIDDYIENLRPGVARHVAARLIPHTLRNVLPALVDQGGVSVAHMVHFSPKVRWTPGGFRSMTKEETAAYLGPIYQACGYVPGPEPLTLQKFYTPRR